VRGCGRCRRGSTKIEKEMIFRITCMFQERVCAPRTSLCSFEFNFLGRIDKVYADLVGSDLGSG
jgi:hypothetical protein